MTQDSLLCPSQSAPGTSGVRATFCSEAQWFLPDNPLAKMKKAVVGEMVFFWPILLLELLQGSGDAFLVMVFVRLNVGKGKPWLSGVAKKLLLDRQVTELPEVCPFTTFPELPG